MAIDPVTMFFVGTLVTAAGSVVEAQATREAEKVRQMNLGLEKNQADLTALDREIIRLRELNFANADQLANSSGGNVEAFDSPSFIALRRANRTVAQRDIDNLNLDKALTKANIDSKIALSKARSKVATFRGILAVASTIFAGVGLAKALAGPKILADASVPLGALDLPQSKPGVILG